MTGLKCKPPNKTFDDFLKSPKTGFSAQNWKTSTGLGFIPFVARKLSHVTRTQIDKEGALLALLLFLSVGCQSSEECMFYLFAE